MTAGVSLYASQPAVDAATCGHFASCLRRSMTVDCAQCSQYFFRMIETKVSRVMYENHDSFFYSFHAHSVCEMLRRNNDGHPAKFGLGGEKDPSCVVRTCLPFDTPLQRRSVFGSAESTVQPFESLRQHRASQFGGACQGRPSGQNT